MSMVKKLCKSKRNRVLGGVLGGLGEYIGVDANVLRLVYVGLLVLGMFWYFKLVIFLVVMYFLAWLLIPEEDVMAGE